MTGSGQDSVDLSVVSPCFNEEENVERLYSELTRVLEPSGISYELILVENGSSDRTMELLSGIAAKDPRVKVVQLTRNFSYQGGITAGMEFAAGKNLITIDADLQDPPELIPELYAKAQEGYDVVYGIRRSRQEGFFKRFAYQAFYRLMRKITPFEIPLDAGDFALVTRPVLDAIRSLPERDRFLRGLRAWVGFRSTGIEYDRHARTAGESKFSVVGLFMLAFQGLFSFSFVPIRALFYFGLVVLGLVLPLVGGYVVWRIADPAAWPPGLATLIILNLLQLGLVMAGIGLIGEYLTIVFVEVKARPVFITRELINLSAEPDRPARDVAAPAPPEQASAAEIAPPPAETPSEDE